MIAAIENQVDDVGPHDAPPSRVVAALMGACYLTLRRLWLDEHPDYLLAHQPLAVDSLTQRLQDCLAAFRDRQL